MRLIYIPVALSAALIGCGGASGTGNTASNDDSTTTSNDSVATETNDSASGSSEEGTDDGMPKLDVSNDEGGNCQGPPECGEVEFSYLWVANAPESTVSKKPMYPCW